MVSIALAASSSSCRGDCAYLHDERTTDLYVLRQPYTCHSMGSFGRLEQSKAKQSKTTIDYSPTNSPCEQTISWVDPVWRQGERGPRVSIHTRTRTFMIPSSIDLLLACSLVFHFTTDTSICERRPQISPFCALPDWADFCNDGIFGLVARVSHNKLWPAHESAFNTGTMTAHCAQEHFAFYGQDIWHMQLLHCSVGEIFPWGTFFQPEMTGDSK